LVPLSRTVFFECAKKEKMIADCCLKYHSKAVAKVTESLGCVYHCCQIRDVLLVCRHGSKREPGQASVAVAAAVAVSPNVLKVIPKTMEARNSQNTDCPRRKTVAEFRLCVGYTSSPHWNPPQPLLHARQPPRTHGQKPCRTMYRII
jgi:hypothetical protein